MAYTKQTWTDGTSAANAARLNHMEQGIFDAHDQAGGVDIQVGGSQPAEGWWLDNGRPLPDFDAPTTPTGLTATATGGTTVDLSWSASTDNIGVTGYEYRVDGGTAVNAGAGTTETVGGLSGSTSYDFEVRAYDAAGNSSGWSDVASATTLAGPDNTDPTPGSLAASAITDTTFTLTVTGASDDIALHASPYAFSTDNGSTWSPWQSSASLNVTGRTASTEYQARHKVRDTSSNEAVGTAITVTTEPPTPLVADDFNRADSPTLGSTPVGSQAWQVAGGGFEIASNKAKASSTTSMSYLDAVTPTSDMRVVVKVAKSSTGSTQSKLRLRYDQTSDSAYEVTLSGNPASPAFSVTAVLDGVTQSPIDGDPGHPLATIPGAYIAGQEYELDVTLREEAGDTRVIVLIDGEPALDLVHSYATRPQGTGIALVTNGTSTTTFDDLLVYSA